MIPITAPKGLGDQIYLRAVVLHMLRRKESLMVFTQFPCAFCDLPVVLKPLAKTTGEERYVGYRLGRTEENDNFTAACLRAGITEPVNLKMKWTVKNTALVERIKEKAKGRKIFVYQPTKIPKNEEQRAISPQRDAYNRFIADHHDHFRIKLGQPPYVEENNEAPHELDLFGKASIHDAFDIGTIGDLFFGESCFIPMMGEAMDKRYAIMFTRRALNATNRIRNMKPERLFHKKHLATAVYDES